MMKQSTPTLSFGFLEKLIKTNINKKGMEIVFKGHFKKKEYFKGSKK